MNTSERINSIFAKRNELNNDAQTKALAEDELRQELMDAVRSLHDRIADVLAVGKALQENGFLEARRMFDRDRRLIPYGYDGGIIAEGFYHHVGFMMRKGCNTHEHPEWVGIRMGGACGSYDFYTDGVDVLSIQQDTHVQQESVPIRHIQQFLNEFPVFEKALYAWVDAGMKPC